MKTTITALDFGTSKIVTLVAENSGSSRCDIVGTGIAAYDGYLAAGWNNPGDLNDQIAKSITDAEKQLKHRKITHLNVGVPAAFTKVYSTEARVTLTGTDPRVTPQDVKAIFRAAEKTLGDPVGVVVHSSPAWFCVDDGKKHIEPVGLKGRELRAMISFVVADRYFVDEVNQRLQSMGYIVDGFYSTAAGEAMLFLSEEDRDRTCALIDIGYLNTDVMIVEGDAIIYLDTIDIGGGNISADLAMGLDIPLRDAEEKIKRRYIFGTDVTERTYDLPGVEGQAAKSFTREQVTDIICSRVDEIADEIKKRFADSGVKLGNWSNIYLTGGGLSFNRGGREYLAARLDKMVKDTPKRTMTFNSHSYSSTLGLMDLIIDTVEQNHQPARNGGAIREFFRSLFGG